MKVNIKQSYIEFLDHIRFPSFMYYYETNRMIGMNQLSKDILGENVKNIKDIFNTRPKLSKKTLRNGSLILYGQEVNSKDGTIAIDIEINVIALDEKHMCIVFFEHTYKQNFKKYLKWEIPRIYWKNREQLYLGMNGSFKDDFSIMLTNEEIQNGDYRNIDFVEKELEGMADVEEIRVMKGRESLYNLLQMIKTPGGGNIFAINNCIPFFNKNGTVIGLIGAYHLVLENENFKRQYALALKENYEIYENQVSMNEFYVKLVRITQMEADCKRVTDTISDEIGKRFHINSVNICRHIFKGKETQCLYNWYSKANSNHDKGKKGTEFQSTIFRELRKNEYVEINSGKDGEKLKYHLFNLELSGMDQYAISFGDSGECPWTSELTCFLKDITLLYKNVYGRYVLEEEIKMLKNA